MFGILNIGPSLIIIDLIANKKISKKKELENIFLRGPAGKADSMIMEGAIVAPSIPSAGGQLPPTKPIYKIGKRIENLRR